MYDPKSLNYAVAAPHYYQERLPGPEAGGTAQAVPTGEGEEPRPRGCALAADTWGHY